MIAAEIAADLAAHWTMAASVSAATAVLAAEAAADAADLIQRKIDAARARLKLAGIPVPGKSKKYEKVPYRVYRIYWGSGLGSNVYKYGITRQPNNSRPVSQLSSCSVKVGKQGQYNVVGTYIGYSRARLAEANLIYAYKVRWGRCPIGQPSCK